MAETPIPEAGPQKKKSKLPLLIGLALMPVLGGGGFYATYSGMILGSPAEPAHSDAETVEPMPEVAFVPVEPLVISLGSQSRSRHLRFASQLEVPKARQEEVMALMPRIVDVLNGYLRAVEVRELEDPTALIRLRAQMLRRVQMVAGDGRVHDLLVSEFVLN